jgi:hypothetical protein
MNRLKNILALTTVCCCYINFVSAQSYDVPKTELLQYLYKTNAVINEVTNIDPQKKIIPLSEKNLINHTHEILKNKAGLYVLIDQTGRIYKAVNESKNSLTFTRVDSTYYWGYNGGAIEFSYNDTLFSFGGFGFWRTNGQLRYYSNVFHEWNIAPINNEYPTKDYINYYYQGKSSLYYCQTPYHDPVTSKYNDEYCFYKLNLKTKNNEKIGNFSDSLISILKNHQLIHKINLPSINGILLFYSYENMLLLKFDDNTVYKLTNKNIKDLILGNSNSDHIRNTFEINGSVFYTLSNDNTDKLHQFQISLKDFVKMNYPIYLEQNERKSYLPMVSSLLSILIITLIILLKRYKKGYHQKVNYKIKNDHTLDINEFTEIEMSLIHLIITNTKKGRHISPEEINNTLGVSKKTFSNQKKVKGDTINKINHKFKILFNKDINLIERERSEFDRRFYNYIISQENSKLYSDRYLK